MPISSFLAPSAIAKPGVCTSSTRPASPYEGQVIYETDTDEVLVWNGSAWVAPNSTTANPPGLEYITQSSFTTSTAVNVNNCFTTAYDNYKLVISMVGSVAGNAYYLRYRSGGADNSTTSYFYYGFYWTTSAVNLTTTSATSHFLNNRSTGTSYDSTFVEVFNPQRAVLTSHQVDAIEVNTGLLIRTGGFFNGTNQFDGFTLFPGSGNMTGTVRVYGYRQA